MKRRIKQKLTYQHPQKYFRSVRKNGNRSNQGASSILRGDPTSDEIEFPQPCACIEDKIMKIKETREKWFVRVKACLDDECYIHEESCSKKSIDADYTPLHNAVKEGNEEIVRLLLKDKAQVDSKSKYDLTPLHIAIHRGNLKIVEILLRHEASMDSKFSFENLNYSPLDLAIFGLHTDVVKFLLSRKKSDECKKNFTSYSPRLFWSTENCIEINAYVLLLHLDSFNETRKSTLFDTIEVSLPDYQDIVNRLLKFCPSLVDIKKVLREFMHYAVERGYLKIVENFLIWGENIDIINYKAYASHVPRLTLLHTAVKHDRYDIAKVLIDNGADIDAKDVAEKSPILYAFEKNRVKMLKLLLNHGARIDENPDLLLNAVMISKNCEIVEILLQNGFGVNYRDELGRTPLHLGVRRTIWFNSFAFFLGPDLEENSEDTKNNSLSIIKLLLDNGADVNARDNNCHTPLHVAAQSNNSEAVEILLKHESTNVDAVGEYRSTALLLAAENGHEKIVEILLNNCADVNFEREDGKTALIRATERGQDEVVRVLLQYNADIEAKVSNGDTAIDIAFKRLASFNAKAYASIIMLLLRSGADVNSINSLNTYMCANNDAPIFLREHIVKMRAAGMYVDEKKFESVVSSSRMIYYLQACKEEVDKLKIEKIGNSNFSLYDILTKDSHQLASICCNEEIVEALESECYKESFPIYSSMIETNFRKGQKREILLHQALCSFNSLIDRDFLDVLSADMLKYLSNKDLNNLAEASTV